MRRKFKEMTMQKIADFAKSRGLTSEMLIYQHLAEGKTVRALAEDIGISRSTLQHLMRLHEPFSVAREQGRKDGADAHADDILEIVDALKDKEDLTTQDVTLAKERVQARKWLAGIQAPDRYAKVEQRVTVNVGELHLEALKKPMRVVSEAAAALPNE